MYEDLELPIEGSTPGELAEETPRAMPVPAAEKPKQIAVNVSKFCLAKRLSKEASAGFVQRMTIEFPNSRKTFSEWDALYEQHATQKIG